MQQTIGSQLQQFAASDGWTIRNLKRQFWREKTALVKCSGCVIGAECNVNKKKKEKKQEKSISQWPWRNHLVDWKRTAADGIADGPKRRRTKPEEAEDSFPSFA